MKHLSKEASKLGKLRKKLQAVELWTRRRHVSLRLRRRIRSYYAEVWVRHNGAHQALQIPGGNAVFCRSLFARLAVL